MAIWGDDPSSDIVDGLVSEETFEIRMYGSDSDREYKLRLIQVYEGPGLRYKTDGMSVIQMGIVQDYVPEEFGLLDVYPNPFNSTTRITYYLEREQQVSILLYDSNGRIVTTLIPGNTGKGFHSTILDGNSLASGIYIVKLVGENFSSMKKAVLVR